MQSWITAMGADFIVVEGRQAYAAPDLAAPPDPERVLHGWVRAATPGLGLDDEPCAGCITVLHELSTSDRPLSVDELADAVAATEPGMADGEPCPDCGRVHDGATLLGIGGLLGAGPRGQGRQGDADGPGPGLVRFPEALSPAAARPPPG